MNVYLIPERRKTLASEVRALRKKCPNRKIANAVARQYLLLHKPAKRITREMVHESLVGLQALADMRAMMSGRH